MKTKVDGQLREEAEHYRFRFGCEDCAYFQTETDACALEYPNHAHHSVVLGRVLELSFCKEFELL